MIHIWDLCGVGLCVWLWFSVVVDNKLSRLGERGVDRIWGGGGARSLLCVHH